MRNHIQISLAENNINGNRSGLVNWIDFSLLGESFLKVTPLAFMQGEKVDTETGRLIIMYDTRIKHNGCTEWYGNMIWNMYQVPFDYALGFLQLLQRSKRWAFDEGWTDIMKKWKAGKEITGKDLDLDKDIQPLVVNPNQYNIKF